MWEMTTQVSPTLGKGPLLHHAMSAVSVGVSLASAGKMLRYAKVVVDVELEEFLTGRWDSLPSVCCVFMVLKDFLLL